MKRLFLVLVLILTNIIWFIYFLHTEPGDSRNHGDYASVGYDPGILVVASTDTIRSREPFHVKVLPYFRYKRKDIELHGSPEFAEELTYCWKDVMNEDFMEVCWLPTDSTLEYGPRSFILIGRAQFDLVTATGKDSSVVLMDTVRIAVESPRE